MKQAGRSGVSETKGLTLSDKVVKADEERRREPTPENYVMREKATQRPFTGAYNHTTAKGMYHCADCNYVRDACQLASRLTTYSSLKIPGGAWYFCAHST